MLLPTAPERSGWRATSTVPPSYTCAHDAVWRDGACGKAADKYAAHQDSLRSLGIPGARDASAQLLRLLRWHTVVVAGDSMATNLFCALTCALLRAAASDGNQTSVALQQSSWPPWPRAVALTIGTNLSGPTLVNLPGACPHYEPYGLAELAASDRVRATPRLLVVANACGAHRKSDLFGDVFAAIENMTLPQWLGAPGAAVWEEAAAGGYASYAERAEKTYGHLATISSRALLTLASASPANLGLLLSTPPPHFPAAEGCLHHGLSVDSVAERHTHPHSHTHTRGGARHGGAAPPSWCLPTNASPGAWDEWIVSLSFYLRSAARSATSDGETVEGSGAAAVAAALALFGLRAPPYRPASTALLGLPQGSLAVHGLSRLHASCADEVAASAPSTSTSSAAVSAPSAASGGASDSSTPSVWRCVLRALKASRHPTANLLTHRPTECASPSELYAGGTASPSLWRQRAESSAAASVGVPLLDRTPVRAPRADLHTGIEYRGLGGDTARQRFDCAHSAFAPGAWDGEILALLRHVQRGLRGKS